MHEVEAFGPVSTVLPYSSTAQLIELAARGQGSRWRARWSPATPTSPARSSSALAPWHGRLLVLDRADAKESTGHGSPMPQLVHGGPGRAGGGEELGGIRGVRHHMQRTAVQGSPDMLTAITGRWFAGSARTVTDVHPFRKSLAELRLGDTVVGGPRTVTQEDVEHFAEFTGDTFYAHMDAEAAAANPFFGERVAHGYLVVSLAAGLFVDPAPGPVLANFGVDHLRFLTPVRFGERAHDHADRQADQPAGRRRLRRGAVGRRRDQPGRRVGRALRRADPGGQGGAVVTIVAAAQRMWDDDAASRKLGMELHSAVDGTARVTMRVTEDMVNGHGMCHGGFLFLLADSAFACACNSPGPVTVAAGADIVFVASGRQGDVLEAVATERTRFGRSGVYDVTIRRPQDDQVVAEFRGRSRTIQRS